MGHLILVRHGQSIWNARNLFTGWIDVPLSANGVKEALAVGEILAKHDIEATFTSRLVRAQHTALLALSQHPSGRVPILCRDGRPTPHVAEEGEQMENLSDAWNRLGPQSEMDDFFPIAIYDELNERFYGDLAGHNKDRLREIYGADQVHLWRRSFDVSPPNGESFADTCRRVNSLLKRIILPIAEKAEGAVVIFAHGNTLRATVMEIEQLSEEEISKVEIQTGSPLVYLFRDELWVRS